MFADIARLKEIEEMIITAYGSYKIHRRETILKAIDIGKGLSEAKNIIGTGWLSWLRKFEFDKRNAYRYLKLYEGCKRYNIDPSDLEDTTMKTAENIIDELDAKAKQGKKPVYHKTMIIKRERISLTFQVKKWTHEMFAQYCKRNHCTQQNSLEAMLENYLESIDKDTAQLYRNQYNPDYDS